MGNGVVRTYEFIRHMGSQTQSGCWSVKCVGVSFQKEPTQLCLDAVFPKRRSSPFFITLQKAVVCRLVGVCRDAVSRLTRIAGDHARALHDELVRDLQVKEAQADEKWNFVGKKGKSLHG